MPAYISHAIMGNDIYNKYINDEKIFKIDVDIETLKTYSLGIDLASFTGAKSFDPHNNKTQKFLIYFSKLFSDPCIRENEFAIAILYGHIAHYFLDVITHPLIYFMENGTLNGGLVNSHQLIEGLIDSFLCEKSLNTDISLLKKEFTTNGFCDDDSLKFLINKAYFDVYGINNMSLCYETTLAGIEILESIVKSRIFNNKKLLTFISGYNSFLENNGLTKEIILNSNNNSWLNPVTGDVSNDSFLDLYNKAILDTADAIYEVNKCIYDGASFDHLTSVFTDLSYDTGVSCSYGKDFKYSRVLTKKKISC